VGLGTAAFSMQDILLEPYGGQVFAMSVGQTTWLTSLLAAGSLAGFALAAQTLGKGTDPCRIASFGALIGILAFAAIIFAPVIDAPNLFRTGTIAIGLGGGLFAVGLLTSAMDLARGTSSGLALGAWGAVQATSAGIAIAISGTLRDGVSTLANSGLLGDAMRTPAAGYNFVYNIEIALLFATLVALGPLVRLRNSNPSPQFGIAEYPA
jgi:MFS transporter, BCD family, chlorophyll transporter